MWDHKECSVLRTDNVRIALFLPFLHQGGVEQAMLNLAQGFVERRVKVDLVLATKAEGPYKSRIPLEVQVIELRASKPMASLLGLVRYLRVRKPHALLSGLTPANLVALWAQRLSRVKETKVFIQIQVSVGIPESTTRFRALLRPFVYRLFYPWADGIIAASQGVEEELLRFGLPDTKIYQICNPVVTKEIFEKAEESIKHPWFALGEPPVILSAGRLHKQKDFPTLIRAFALVRKERLSRLIILGEGEEWLRLKSLVRELGLEREVDFPGFVQNPYAYMKRAALFVLSSAWEGFGNVLAEAMAIGTPVISTDCPHGPAQILEGGKWGILLPVGDVEALAKAIIEALDRPCDHDALRRRAQAFSVDAIVSQYMEIMGIGK
jgi:glycosyltransferase involved in cell wall biosynthesis